MEDMKMKNTTEVLTKLGLEMEVNVTGIYFYECASEHELLVSYINDGKYYNFYGHVSAYALEYITKFVNGLTI